MLNQICLIRGTISAFMAISIATFIAVLVPIAVFIAVLIVVFSGQNTTYCGISGDRSKTPLFQKIANRYKKSPKPIGFGDNCSNISCKSALAELRRAMGGLQTVLLTLGSRNPLWRNGLRTRVFKIAVLIATLFIVVSLFYTSSRLYRDANKSYDIMVTWTIL